MKLVGKPEKYSAAGKGWMVCGMEEAYKKIFQKEKWGEWDELEMFRDDDTV